VQMFWRLTTNQKTLAIGFIKRLHAICIRAANGNETAATAFIARFTQRTLRSLSLESRGPSRAASPTGAGEAGPTTAMADQDFMADLVGQDLRQMPAAILTLGLIRGQDEFLASTNMFTDTTRDDEQYWSVVICPDWLQCFAAPLTGLQAISLRTNSGGRREPEFRSPSVTVRVTNTRASEAHRAMLYTVHSYRSCRKPTTKSLAPQHPSALHTPP
jgi:hypothetical protein